MLQCHCSPLMQCTLWVCCVPVVGAFRLWLGIACVATDFLVARVVVALERCHPAAVLPPHKRHVCPLFGTCDIKQICDMWLKVGIAV